MDGALRPTIFKIPDFISEEKVGDITDEEKVLGTGADKIFWKTLVKHFDNAMQALEQINEAAISGGMPLEEIGRNALVISQVKGVLKKIINVVEDSKQGMEAHNGEETK